MPKSDDLWPLLTDQPMDGPRIIERLLRPTPPAALLPTNAGLEDVASALASTCAAWGGAFAPLLPTGPHGIPPEWLDILARSPVTTVAGTTTSAVISEQLSGLGLRATNGPLLGTDLIAVLAFTKPERYAWNSVHTCARVPLDNDWFVSYAGTLGAKPSTPSPDSLQLYGLVPELDYDTVVKFDSAHTTDIGGADLLKLLREPQSTTSARLTAMGLQIFSAGVNSSIHIEEEEEFRNRHAKIADVGPNIVVVYEPGSVEDLTLLWQLRAIHGLPEGFPLAVPITADVPAVIAHWVNEHAMRLFGFGRDREWLLVSRSIDQSDLVSLAAATRNFSAGNASDLLREAHGAGVLSVQPSHFNDGTTEIAPFTPEDREIVGSRVLDRLSHHLEIQVSVIGEKLPYSKVMRTRSVGHRIQEGVIVRPSRDSSPVTVTHPTGLDVLDAFARDRGLRARPSRPGLVAEHTIRRLTGVEGLWNLASPDCVALLDLFASRRGTRLIREGLQRFLKVDANTPEDTLERVSLLEQRLEDHLGMTDIEDLREVTPGDVRRFLRHDRAINGWLSWAEQNGLILRGLVARCPRCELRQWAQLANLAASPACAGCGDEIRSAMNSQRVEFSYRATYPLLQLMELDVLPHILTFRYLSLWLSRGPSGRSGLYGAYPGVEFIDPDSGRVVAEADVLLILSDGSLAAAECKTSARGLTDDELEKLIMLRERLGLTITLGATLSPLVDVPTRWRDAVSDGVHVLTAEHLFDPYPLNLLNGPHPLEARDSYWTRGQRTSIEELRGQYAQDVANASANGSWWRAPWRLDD